MKRTLRDQQGQSLVELALVLPILLVIVLGVMTFGIAINTKIAVSTAAREAARNYAVFRDASQARQKAYDSLRQALPVSSTEFNQNFNPASDVAISVSGGIRDCDCHIPSTCVRPRPLDYAGRQQGWRFVGEAEPLFDGSLQT